MVSAGESAVVQTAKQERVGLIEWHVFIELPSQEAGVGSSTFYDLIFSGWGHRSDKN